MAEDTLSCFAHKVKRVEKSLTIENVLGRGSSKSMNQNRDDNSPLLGGEGGHKNHGINEAENSNVLIFALSLNLVEDGITEICYTYMIFPCYTWLLTPDPVRNSE